MNGLFLCIHVLDAVPDSVQSRAFKSMVNRAPPFSTGAYSAFCV